MQIKWLKAALQNLESEADYIARNNAQAAQTVVLRIHTAINLLCENPNLGRLGRVEGTRELVVPETRHIIPYRINTELEQVQILRIFHTSRRLPRHW